MKQTIRFISVMLLAVLLAGCGRKVPQESADQSRETEVSETAETVKETSSSETPAISSSESDTPTVSETTTSAEPTTTTEKTTHEEYVEHYRVYAEENAEVTWFDSETGEYRFKWKCGSCGTMQSGETMGYLKSGKLNKGFTCTNSKCSMWGKSQESVIGCEATGEWVIIED